MSFPKEKELNFPFFFYETDTGSDFVGKQYGIYKLEDYFHEIYQGGVSVSCNVVMCS